jgi:uncharacterized protein YfdQ (DUF2303 family)
MNLVAELAAKGATPAVITSEKEHFIIVPAGTELKSLREFQYAEAPIKKTGLAQMLDVPSFAGYFVRFRDEDSMIFSDPEKFTFTGILDMHKEGAGDARRKEHKVHLELRRTKRWLNWWNMNRQPKPQEDFSQFIEDNLPDIFQPEGTQYPSAGIMLEVSRSLAASSSYQFNQATNLKNGQKGLVYREVIEGVAGPQGEIPIPDAFNIRVPIFLNQKPVDVVCRLRYRISSGKLSMWYDMLRVDEMLAAEFEAARIAVSTASGCEVLLGAA